MIRTTRRLAAAALLLGLVALPACGGKDDGQTNPTLELNSGDIGAGGTYPHTFAATGSFNYRCTRHPTMTGTVTVSSGAPMSVAVSIGNVSAGFSPAAATVGIGGTVTWTNNDSELHTVTSTN